MTILKLREITFKWKSTMIKSPTRILNLNLIFLRWKSFVRILRAKSQLQILKMLKYLIHFRNQLLKSQSVLMCILKLSKFSKTEYLITRHLWKLENLPIILLTTIVRLFLQAKGFLVTLICINYQNKILLNKIQATLQLVR